MGDGNRGYFSLAEGFFVSFYGVGELFDSLGSVSGEVFSFSPIDSRSVNIDSFGLRDFQSLEKVRKSRIF